MDQLQIITDFLRDRGGSMVDLARRLGLPRQAVYDWCRRGSLRLSHLERIAAAYGYRCRVAFEPIQDIDDDNSSEKQTVKNC